MNAKWYKKDRTFFFWSIQFSSVQCKITFYVIGFASFFLHFLLLLSLVWNTQIYRVTHYYGYDKMYSGFLSIRRCEHFHAVKMIHFHRLLTWCQWTSGFVYVFEWHVRQKNQFTNIIEIICNRTKGRTNT